MSQREQPKLHGDTPLRHRLPIEAHGLFATVEVTLLEECIDAPTELKLPTCPRSERQRIADQKSFALVPELSAHCPSTGLPTMRSTRAGSISTAVPASSLSMTRSTAWLSRVTA